MNRLINFFKPKSYDISLDIDKKNRQFIGYVEIKGTTTGAEIRLHARHLNIKSIIVDDKVISNYKLLENDELSIPTIGSVIKIDFSGSISETNLHGLYLGKYQHDDQPKEMLVTQFEAHYARELFPSIDEPEAKATFKLRIKVDEPIVLSNMPGKKIGQIWEFDKTPVMSTYLLAICAGDFIKKTTKTNSGIEVNVYATSNHHIDDLDYALDTAKRAIEFYESYFNVPYPLPKSDHIGVPDFSCGAMENWGLITYRESELLSNEHTPQNSKELIAICIIHELAHQWFGNLVTMKWWDELWLNESFASLMQHFATNKLFPEYNILEDYELSYASAALQRDANMGVQSIQQNVNSPSEIDTLFDSAIVYGKGERLLFMLMEYIGEDSFRNGLTNYFKEFAYTNTTANDLWSCLSEASNQDLSSIMTPWIKQPGYPLISVERDNRSVTLSQQRFFIGNNKPNDDQSIWPVPLFSNAKNAPKLLVNKKTSFKLNDNELNNFSLNLNDKAHYITKYDNETYSGLVNKFHQLNSIDKIKLLREPLLLAQANKASIVDSLKLVSKNFKEDSAAVWLTMWSIINVTKNLLSLSSSSYGSLQELARKLVGNTAHKLMNLNNLSINQRKLIKPVFNCAIFAGDKTLSDYLINIYKENYNNIKSIPSDIRALILRQAVKQEDKNNQTSTHLWLEYKQAPNDLKPSIASALTSTNSADNINLILDNLKDTNMIRPQDTLTWFSCLINRQQEDLRSLTWSWIRQNWSWVEEIFGGDGSYELFVRIISQSLQTEQELDEYRQFFTRLANKPDLRRSILVGENLISSRIDWIKHDKPLIEQWLKNR